MPRWIPISAAAVEIVRVDSGHDLDRWLDVAADGGWISDERDRLARRELYQAVSADRTLVHWLALDRDHPVGFASSYLDDSVLDLCNLGVATARRRQGIGRALVAARLADATSRDATMVVSALRPTAQAGSEGMSFRRVRGAG